MIALRKEGKYSPFLLELAQKLENTQFDSPSYVLIDEGPWYKNGSYYVEFNKIDDFNSIIVFVEVPL